MAKTLRVGVTSTGGALPPVLPLSRVVSLLSRVNGSSCLLAPELSVASQAHTHFHHLLLSYLKVRHSSVALNIKTRASASAPSHAPDPSPKGVAAHWLWSFAELTEAKAKGNSLAPASLYRPFYRRPPLPLPLLLRRPLYIACSFMSILLTY